MNRKEKNYLQTAEHYEQEIESIKYSISINRDNWSDLEIEEAEEEIEKLKAEKDELFNLIIE